VLSSTHNASSSVTVVPLGGRLRSLQIARRPHRRAPAAPHGAADWRGLPSSPGPANTLISYTRADNHVIAQKSADGAAV
jgi:hypothetical protein